ncbi:hypothetical protein BpHYR1_019627 [Brachionus plicatilis]|uniref:Uncharacterized protein n=1 Tax=Brachionus plicatilis TaxID=10195 RepID=A0A3M7QE30_BRAPC|nr:hypothetical protein BpHYR1_019627 [Brachionus plicatilis]
MIHSVQMIAKEMVINAKENFKKKLEINDKYLSMRSILAYKSAQQQQQQQQQQKSKTNDILRKKSHCLSIITLKQYATKPSSSHHTQTTNLHLIKFGDLIDRTFAIRNSN